MVNVARCRGSHFAVVAAVRISFLVIAIQAINLAKDTFGNKLINITYLKRTHDNGMKNVIIPAISYLPTLPSHSQAVGMELLCGDRQWNTVSAWMTVSLRPI